MAESSERCRGRGGRRGQLRPVLVSYRSGGYVPEITTHNRPVHVVHPLANHDGQLADADARVLIADVFRDATHRKNEGRG